LTVLIPQLIDGWERKRKHEIYSTMGPPPKGPFRGGVEIFKTKCVSQRGLSLFQPLAPSGLIVAVNNPLLEKYGYAKLIKILNGYRQL